MVRPQKENDEGSHKNIKKKKNILTILLDKLLLLLSALAIMAILVFIGWYVLTADLRETERKRKADPVYQKVMAEYAAKEKEEIEKQKKLNKLSAKKQAEEKAIADFEKSIKGKYTKEYLLKKAQSDIKMSGHLSNIGGYECMSYYYTSHNWEDDLCYDELSYHIFKNERAAKKAFKDMKKNWIESETDSGTNYVQGIESGVLDATVEVFIYQTDNMIITAELMVASAWSEPEYEDDGNSVVNFYYRKNFIKNNF